MLRLALAALIACTLACIGGASASALPVGAWWGVEVGSRPSSLPTASVVGGVAVPGEGELVVSVENLGDGVSVSETAPGEPGGRGPVTVVDRLPVGLRAVGITGTEPKPAGAASETIPMSCSLEKLSCESSAGVEPYDQLEVRIEVQVLPDAGTGETDAVTVSGGGASEVSVSRVVRVGGGSMFGVEDYGLSVEGEGGVPAVQAGSHPYQVTGTIALDQGRDTAGLEDPPQAGPVVPARDITARLPPGLVANPGAVPRCVLWQFLLSDGGGEQPECSALTAVGVASVTADTPEGTVTVPAPIFNIEPEAGEPARFGFFVPVANVPVVLDTGVRSGPGEDWGVDLSTVDIPAGSGLLSARVTFWGVPDRLSHDASRGWACLAATRGQSEAAYEPCVRYPEEQDPPAFVTMPTSCTGPLQSSVQADSIAAPGQLETFEPQTALQSLTGCDEVAFTPGISTEPTTHSAASPSGLAFDLNFDTEGLTSSSGLAQSDLQKTVATLPEGMTIDPSAGVGLGACTRAQFAEATLSSPAGVGCPEDSKLGTVEIETPLLFTKVYGSMYVAQPYENPFSEPGHPEGSLVALYVIARSRAERGILVKLAGKVTPDPVTGRLTITFENDPQLPFEHFNFHFREGQQAPLISPATCGTFATQAQLTPFSEPLGVLQDNSSFQITSGSEGTACPTGLPPFAPRIQAITLNNDAGIFSPLYIDLSRTDAMQEIASYSASLPQGITADLTGIPFCPESDIQAARAKTGLQEENTPSCPQSSLIGHTLVGTGVGSVLDYVPGKLYLSGSFHGDPLSVVSITSAVVGPFDLGTIVIRFALRIDPYTAQVNIDPSGSEPIPTIIDGIVTHVRDIRVSIDRPNFTINPTNCQPHPVASTLTSNYTQQTSISTPFQAANCSQLPFKPAFKASTQGHTSRANGASLTVSLRVPGGLGANSNIKQVKVELPRQMPSRLTTLQKACTEAQFNTNPAGCPPASMIGHATASTPILPVPLTGPAIFVSHGGEAFPSLILVLQGYGVTIDLVGSTYISPKGITSTTFKSVPDEPVGSFQLTLPEGQYSALTALGNLCHPTKTTTIKRHTTIKIHGHKHTTTRTIQQHKPTTLTMPTEFIAQNGAIKKQTTTIKPTGCPKPHKTTKHKTKHHPTKRHGTVQHRKPHQSSA